MDELLLQFQRCTTLTVCNPTPYALDIAQDGGVISLQPLPKSTVIGEITGVPKYIWDIDHHDYMIVADEFVLDVSMLCPRSVLTYVREENASGEPANCLLVTESCAHTGTNRFFLTSTRDIQAGEELVYFPMEYPYY